MEHSVSVEYPTENARYNQIISQSGGIPTTVQRWQFLEDVQQKADKIGDSPISPRIRSNTSPRVMIPKSWFKKKKKPSKDPP